MPNIRWLLALATRLQRFLYLKTAGGMGAQRHTSIVILERAPAAA